jgi:hypothetical protein
MTGLRTWVMDIRQVMSDNALKDLLAEECALNLDYLLTGTAVSNAICDSHAFRRVGAASDR